MDSMEVILAQARLIAEGRGHASVTILHSDGSTPRSSGKLLVLEDGRTIGSIGGGPAERAAITDALKCLAANRNAVKDYDMTGNASNTGMICGGSIRVFIECYQPRPTLVMCGGGHVGLAVIRLAHDLGYCTVLLDHREREEVSEAAALADSFTRVEDFRAAIAAMELPSDVSYVIATPGHTRDMEALMGALDRGGGYTGMIGSRAKTAAVMSALRERGYGDKQLQGVHAPIGLDIGGETPPEIALSIMAEVQRVRYGGSGQSLRDKAQKGN